MLFLLGILLGALVMAAAIIFSKRAAAKLKPRPAERPDPVTLSDVRDYLEYAGFDSLSFVRQADGTIHILSVDGNTYDNATFFN